MLAECPMQGAAGSAAAECEAAALASFSESAAVRRAAAAEADSLAAHAIRAATLS